MGAAEGSAALMRSSRSMCLAMNPDRHLKSHYDYFLDLIRGDDSNADNHRQFYDEYNAVLDMPAEYYLDTIKTVFQDFALVNGTWVVNGEPVRPQDIKATALLTIEGELDDISGAGQTRAAHDLCAGIPRDRAFHYDAVGAGHYGIFSGRRWREAVYPQVRDFISRFDQLTAASAQAKPPEAQSTKASAKAKRATTPVVPATQRVSGKVLAPAKAAGNRRDRMPR